MSGFTRESSLIALGNEEDSHTDVARTHTHDCYQRTEQPVSFDTGKHTYREVIIYIYVLTAKFNHQSELGSYCATVYYSCPQPLPSKGHHRLDQAAQHTPAIDVVRPECITMLHVYVLVPGLRFQSHNQCLELRNVIV